jgi:hypothetical protein
MFFFGMEPQTMDIVDMANHPVLCQKFDFHRNSVFQNSPKIDSLPKPAKNFIPKYASHSKTFWCKKLAGGALQK